ncbi:hypothetical protein A0H81_04014 [Grifola frondosa]|uniref:Uncharacterized protein n=1 Tax=Grifola frondosa TaxID=5627 RepID=A0A1C7MH58_GRIFR|nr:hypothetical protein A0H81_04014 [Grifola frondosa]
MIRNAGQPLTLISQCIRSSVCLLDSHSSRLASTSTTSSEPSSQPKFPRKDRPERTNRSFPPRPIHSGARPRSRELDVKPGRPEERPAESNRPSYSGPNPINAPYRTLSHGKGSSGTAAKGEYLGKRMLRPAVLSERLIKLSREDRLDDAIIMLQNAPLDAQNAIVWNTLIKHVLEARRYKLAYQLYIDMKRRGFSPTIKTYTTMFGGLSTVQEWSKHTKLLEQVHTLFENYVQYVQSIKERDPSSPDLNVGPIAVYIRILASAGLYQRIFDVYYAMDEEGPLAPTKYTYTAMFQSLSDRRASPDGGRDERGIRDQNASDAKVLWRSMIKRSQKSPIFEPDAFLITSALRVFALGRPADQLFAFDIIRDYLGFAKPGEDPLPPKVELERPLLSDVLWLCNLTRKYRICTYFAQQVMDGHLKAGARAVLDRGHIEQVLTAYGALAAMGTMNESRQALRALEWMLEQDRNRRDDQLRPGLSTYTLVLAACWRGADWESAMRTFELMSGYHAEDFADGEDGQPPATLRMDQRAAGKNVLPDPAAMSFIVRIALASNDPPTMRQCLRIVDHLGVDRWSDVDREDGGRVAAQYYKDQSFYAGKTASAMVELIDKVVPKDTERTVEHERWLGLRGVAKRLLREQPQSRKTPFLEQQPLGSERGLLATDSAVEWELATRQSR